MPNQDDKKSARRLALILATDPTSPTAEHAFYLVETQGSAASVFNDLNHLPAPFLGGGSGVDTDDGIGAVLGSIYPESVMVSPCGRRMAWTDTNGRICVMNLPLYHDMNTTTIMQPNAKKHPPYSVLPDKNELGEPMVGTSDTRLYWSPGGRYLAISHFARNLFSIISIADCGVHTPPNVKSTSTTIHGGRIVQATPSRFNSIDPYWGSARADATLEKYRREKMKVDSRGSTDENGSNKEEDASEKPSYSTLYFLTDRDVMTDTKSPWGSRMPLPHFSTSMVLYALPLDSSSSSDLPIGRFSGGGAMEVLVDQIMELEQQVEKADKEEKESSSNETSSANETSTSSDQNKDDGTKQKFPKDLDIDFGAKDLSFARTAYRIVHVPKDNYDGILSQTLDGSFSLVVATGTDILLKVHAAKDHPSDGFEDVASFSLPTLMEYDVSTCRSWVYFVHKDGTVQVIPNTGAKILAAGGDMKVGKTASDDIAFSVWPKLEYKQMYNDAWRMLRDYFYDVNMHKVNWTEVHQRYLPLVERCTKREELDDVLSQMSAELSALHVFVYGGEYSTPFGGSPKTKAAHQPASLGASLQRTAEWKGYEITEIAYRDPDFNLLDSIAIYSPLSDQALRPSGQKGLQVGDVIVGVNGESAFRVPDIHMLLRGQAKRSVRLEVLRLASSSSVPGERATGSLAAVPEKAIPESVVVVPVSQDAASDLRYNAWEYKTRENAKAMAKEAGFSVAYIHLRSMSDADMDAFARSYFDDYDKDAMILDLRHNLGGNIDSWISAILQRKSIYYFGDRFGRKAVGEDLNWNQHYAFHGSIIVVLIDEKTSSNGEGLARAISELELGFLVGKRTWGGGIWLASDNRLVDGGIASAPEDGVYNEKWGWGMGIGT